VNTLRREVHDMSFAEERLMAERALAIYDLDLPSEPVFPPVATRILRSRKALGLSPDEVAARWGEQPSMYWDLEFHDDEAFTVISVRQLHDLAAVLGASAGALLFGEEPAPDYPSVSHFEMVTRLRRRMAESQISIEQLGDQIGWDLQQAFVDPETLGDLPVCGLRAVCDFGGVDWVAVLRTSGR